MHNSRKFVAVAALMLSSFLASTCAPAQAAEIKKGALVLRSGAANTEISYQNEATDENGKLQNVSALCSPKASSKSKSEQLVKSDMTRKKTNLFQGIFGATQASTIIGSGGTVVSVPLSRNPNHCEISGLKIGQIKGIWSMCTGPNGKGC
jgi:hypothetical protein